MKLCFVDLDGVVADNTERFKRAKEVALEEVSLGVKRIRLDVYWRTAFTPELVSLDMLIDGADEALYRLKEETGYHIVFVTSRPASMRQATIKWLMEHLGLPSFVLVMKESAFIDGRILTNVWKAGMIQTLASFYGADELLVIDDSGDVRQAVLDAYPDGGDFYKIRVVANLAEAIKEG